MTSKPNVNPTDAPSVDFESTLEKLILESFAKGSAIKGTWDVTSSSSVVPNWRVTIEKRDDAELPEDASTFLDE